MTTLQQADAEAAAVAVAPRVTLADIEAAIANRYDFTGADAVDAIAAAGAMSWGTLDHDRLPKDRTPDPLSRLSICILVMRNGFTIIGKSAPASAENFNAELGRKFAYEDAVRQIWPLMGFALREKLAAA